MTVPILAIAGLTDIPYVTKGGKQRKTTGAYFLVDSKKGLQITIRDVSKDEVDPEGLLDFLVVNNVIDNPHKWQFGGVQDTGSQSFTTVIFVLEPVS